MTIDVKIRVEIKNHECQLIERMPERVPVVCEHGPKKGTHLINYKLITKLSAK